MERRSAERYFIDLEADASGRPCGDGDRNSNVRIKDISGTGAAFYDAEGWCAGDPVSMVIHFRDGIVGPFSYNMKVKGRIVRTDFEEFHGKAMCAVAFDGGLSLSDWMEIESRGLGNEDGTSGDKAGSNEMK